ncbi:hypothetical protein Hanom_Chr06g00567961 [Helianthus anomalus]
MDGSWIDPHQMKNKGKQTANFEDIHLGEKVTKFYVTNLLKGCTSWEVSGFMKVYGEIRGLILLESLIKIAIGLVLSAS